jgi:hypothetical protein
MIEPELVQDVQIVQPLRSVQGVLKNGGSRRSKRAGSNRSMPNGQSSKLQ